uniref:Uncharacterized protein n=1 Tax=Oryzias latipes TaxID=8090 RepID=A0A3P9IXT4_ORYLA
MNSQRFWRSVSGAGASCMLAFPAPQSRFAPMEDLPVLANGLLQLGQRMRDFVRIVLLIIEDFRVAFSCGQSKVHLSNNHAICEQYFRELVILCKWKMFHIFEFIP